MDCLVEKELNRSFATARNRRRPDSAAGLSKPEATSPDSASRKLGSSTRREIARFLPLYRFAFGLAETEADYRLVDQFHGFVIDVDTALIPGDSI